MKKQKSKKKKNKKKQLKKTSIKLMSKNAISNHVDITKLTLKERLLGVINEDRLSFS